MSFSYDNRILLLALMQQQNMENGLNNKMSCMILLRSRQLN